MQGGTTGGFRLFPLLGFTAPAVQYSREAEDRREKGHVKLKRSRRRRKDQKSKGKN